jgi:drug/metabolite transporter (DMT)-like permease
MVYLTLPVSALAMLVAAIYVDLMPWLIVLQHESFYMFALCLFLLVVGSFISFSLLYFEYSVVKEFDSLTLSIVGVTKEVLALILSVTVFGEKLSIVQCLGVLVSIGGILLYSALLSKNAPYAGPPSPEQQMAQLSPGFSVIATS